MRVSRAGRGAMIATGGKRVMLPGRVDAERADPLDVDARLLQASHAIFRFGQHLETAGDDRGHLMPPSFVERLSEPQLHARGQEVDVAASAGGVELVAVPVESYLDIAGDAECPA